MLSPILSSPRAERVTWGVWGVVLLAACAVLAFQPDRRPVNGIYARAAARFRAGLDLYDEGGCGFIYLPPSAVLYLPLTFIPGLPQNVLWRTITIGLFAAGVHRLSRLAAVGTGLQFFPLVSLFVLPKAWASMINGQATPAMAGLSLLALGEIFERRWWRAAACLVAALAFKPLAIVLVLLVAALYRPLTGRLTLGIAGLLAAPYLAQAPEYVTQQYLGAIGMLEQAARRGLTPEWAQLFSLASLVGIEVPATWQTLLRVLAALATLALCARAAQWRIARSMSAPGNQGAAHAGSARLLSNVNRDARPDPAPRAAAALLTLYSLATAYLLLFNPRTENNTYLMLSPAIGALCVRARFVERKVAQAAGLCAAGFALVAGHAICGFLTPNSGFIWICPFVCLLFAGGISWGVVRAPARSCSLPPGSLHFAADPALPDAA